MREADPIIRWNSAILWYLNTISFNGNSSDILLKGLEQNHQRSFNYPNKVIEDLIFGNPLELNALNYLAHSIWAYALFEELTKLIKFDQSEMHLYEPVFFVTLIDHLRVRGVPKTDLELSSGDLPWKESATDGPHINYLINRQRLALSPEINSIGFVELAICVSTQRVSAYLRFYEYHSHHLIWGCSKREIEQSLRSFNRRALPGLTGRTPVQIKEIGARDLPRVVSYATKMPFQQRQWFTDRETGKVKVRPPARLQPINYVRAARELAGVSLPELTIATGRGALVLKRAQDPALLFEALQLIV